MGFGSYDESEQGEQEINVDADESQRINKEEHDGEVSFTGGDSPDELLDRLQDIKTDSESEE